jgi:hypothetical protein
MERSSRGRRGSRERFAFELGTSKRALRFVRPWALRGPRLWPCSCGPRCRCSQLSAVSGQAGCSNAMRMRSGATAQRGVARCGRESGAVGATSRRPRGKRGPTTRARGSRSCVIAPMEPGCQSSTLELRNEESPDAASPVSAQAPCFSAHPGRFELPTLGFVVRCSIQLSYGCEGASA